MDRLGEAVAGAKLNLLGLAEVLENAATAFKEKVSGPAKDTRSRERAAVAGKVCHPLLFPPGHAHVYHSSPPTLHECRLPL